MEWVWVVTDGKGAVGGLTPGAYLTFGAWVDTLLAGWLGADSRIILMLAPNYF